MVAACRTSMWYCRCSVEWENQFRPSTTKRGVSQDVGSVHATNLFHRHPDISTEDTQHHRHANLLLAQTSGTVPASFPHLAECIVCSILSCTPVHALPHRSLILRCIQEGCANHKIVLPSNAQYHPTLPDEQHATKNRALDQPCRDLHVMVNIRACLVRLTGTSHIL